MNIHGYKKKYKSMVNILKREINKGNNSETLKIKRLINAKQNCMNKIKK